MFLKKLYPNYIIIFIRKKELVTFDMDNKIINFCRKKKEKIVNTLEREEINYFIIDNLDIIKKREFINNRYLEYKKKVIISNIYFDIYEKINKY